MDRLRRLQSDPAHAWWEANVSFTDAALLRPTAMRGHRQVTGLYLAGLAQSRGGKLVTFDRGVLWNAVVDAKPSLAEVLSGDDG